MTRWMNEGPGSSSRWDVPLRQGSLQLALPILFPPHQSKKPLYLYLPLPLSLQWCTVIALCSLFYFPYFHCISILKCTPMTFCVPKISRFTKSLLSTKSRNFPCSIYYLTSNGNLKLWIVSFSNYCPSLESDFTWNLFPLPKIVAGPVIFIHQ